MFLMDIERGPDFDTGTPLFRCSACQHCWERTYQGSGLFKWRRVPGMIVTSYGMPPPFGRRRQDAR